MVIALDLDDTLYLERDYVRSGFRAVSTWLRKTHGFPDVFKAAWGYFEQARRGDIFDRVVEDMQLGGAELVARMVEIYRSHRPDIQLLPDSQAFLSRYPRASLAIITDGYAVSQWAKIDALGLRQVVDRIIVTGDWDREDWKPNPRAFIEIQGKRLPKCCVHIADNPAKDFVAPTGLGWRQSIRVRRPGSLHYDVATPEDCLEVSSLEEAEAILARDFLR